MTFNILYAKIIIHFVKFKYILGRNVTMAKNMYLNNKYIRKILGLLKSFFFKLLGYIRLLLEKNKVNIGYLFILG